MSSKKLHISRILTAAERKGYNQADIAKAIGVTRQIVSQWFKEEKFPKPIHLIKLGSILSLDFDQMVFVEENENDPQVAFRKKGHSKIYDEHISKAKEMGVVLELLSEHLPFDELSSPPVLIKPQVDYDYINKVADSVRKELNKSPKEIIDFRSLIDFFPKMKAVLVPVLWGEQKSHCNALHIYLPKKSTTWIYFNLDVHIHDFKFWMAHELAHIKAIKLKGDEAEDFADQFAEALLISQEQTEFIYNKIKGANFYQQKEYILKYAEDMVISPSIVGCRLNRYAEHIGREKLKVNQHAMASDFNRQFNLLSNEILSSDFNSRTYIKKCEELFKTPFFVTLKEYLLKHSKSAPVISEIMNVSILDAYEIYAALMNE